MRARIHRRLRVLSNITGVCLMAMFTIAQGQEAQPAPEDEPAPETTASAVAPAPEHAPTENAALYCRNIASAAADARYARQLNALTALEAELTASIAELEAKRAEYEEWVSRREKLFNSADKNVVAIYSQMRPDAAAQQFAVMDAGSAAAILAKISPRTASAILNEMPAETAAFLTNFMSGRTAASKAAGVSG